MRNKNINVYNLTDLDFDTTIDVFINKAKKEIKNIDETINNGDGSSELYDLQNCLIKASKEMWYYKSMRGDCNS